MTDANRSMNDLPALLEERRKYEAWLAALEARRESTPEHVFSRVKGDYESRLTGVKERLAAHRHAIDEERASLSSRRALLDAEVQLRRDERAELELRAHVGELSDADSEAAFKAVDDTLNEMGAEREKLDARIAELDGLVDGSVVTPVPAVEVLGEPAPALASASAETERIEEVPSLESLEEPKAEAAAPAAEQKPLHTPGGSFDELAFLSDVVGPSNAEPIAAADKASDKLHIVRDESMTDSILSDLARKDRKSDNPPLASNVPANTPIVLRPSGSIEQSKTLKCTECGAMNYPTEWYCERCGAELAAL